MNNILVSFLTPKKVELKGVWLGAARPHNLYILVHGLGGSLFSRAALSMALGKGKDAVLTFNNRGSGTINYFWTRKKGKTGSLLGGVAHEVFTDCLDDLDGVLAYARQRGARNIFLLGHSTGCQKSIYYLAKRPRSVVKGVILLAPISDYSDVAAKLEQPEYRRALAAAERLKRMGRPHALLPAGLWPTPLDAQRFLSLYTAKSQEEIFTYASGRKPLTLQAVKKPLFTILAEADEFGDRPALEIAAWFEKILGKSRHNQIKIIAGAIHSFVDCENKLAPMIRAWVKTLK